MDLFWSLLRIAIGVYVGLCVFVYLWQSHYVYYPARKIQETPESAGLGFEDVSVLSQDGESIAGWFVPAGSFTGKAGEKPAKTRRTVLVCHGNAGNIGDRIDTIMTFHQMGLNVLIFDYRGYGMSTGKPAEEGTYFDALAMWNYLKAEKKCEAGDVAVFGQSLGGAVATWLAEQVRPGALILESTFTSAADMGARMFPFLPVRWLCSFKYDSEARMGKIHCPLLLAHSRDDETAPFEHGQRLFKAANEPKQFVEMRGDHNSCGIDFCPPFRQMAEEFLRKYLVSDPALKDGGKPEGKT